MFHYRRFDLLIAIYIFCIAVSELMGAKSFPLFTLGSLHLTASVAIFVIPLMFTITDVVTEVYGQARAHSLVLSGLVTIALLLLFSLLATALPPSPRFSSSEMAYDKIFQSSIRIAAASLIAFAISGLLDVYVFAKLRAALGAKALWLRNNLSNFASQLFDTTLFITLAFYATNLSLGHNLAFLSGLIVPYWLLKCVLSVIETPLVYAGVKWLRGDESA